MMKADDFQEGDIYVDTNFLYHFLRPIPEYRQKILAFFQRVEGGKIHAFTCVITFDELAYRILLALIKDKYGSNPTGLLRDQTRAMLKEFYPKVQEVLLVLKSLPNLEFLSVTEAELSEMIDELTSFMLLPRDALHLAVARRHSIHYIASDDRDFDDIEGIERVWMYNPPSM
jgi:predicted nucleic acid-binding protein